MAEREKASGPLTAVLIAGPTASGKSALAWAIAERHGGVVINTDALQVYAELSILTARARAEEERAVPHRLYGHVSARERYSVGQWLVEAEGVLREARSLGRLPIFVGGTGLYFMALTNGLAPVPAIPHEIRAALKERLAIEGAEALHADLVRRDPGARGRVRPSDPARILRALEVLEATGRSLSDWHKAATSPPLVNRAKAASIVLAPDREALKRNIAARLARMVEEGAVEEAAAVAGLGLDPTSSAMKAIGLRHFADHAAGRLTLAEAVDQAAMETSRYAKRQTTWFRNQMADWPRLDPADAAARADVIRSLG